VLDKYVGKVVVSTEVVELHFLNQGLDEIAVEVHEDPEDSCEVLTIPWNRKPFVADKDVAYAPSDHGGLDPLTRDTFLKAIAKARLWIDGIAAGRVQSFTEIAEREGKGERQIRLLAPLAFAPPKIVQSIIDGAAPAATVTNLAKTVPWAWQNM
jgi:hypothetical protein